MAQDKPDPLQLKFIEEATDLLNELEEALLQLERQPGNIPLLQEVFRVMHTLKGNSAMFGFENIGEFTHHFENIYDMARNGQLNITQQVLSISLASVDHIRCLLNDIGLTNPVNRLQHDKLMAEVAKFTQAPSTVSATKQKGEGLCTWAIHFVPESNVMNNGTNLLYLLEELCLLGVNYHVIANDAQIPRLQDLAPKTCYTAWWILLATQADEEAMREVFMFVEDECQLTCIALSSGNLLLHLPFMQAVSAQGYENIDAEFLQHLAANMQQTSENNIGGPVSAASGARNGYGISSVRISSDKLDTMMNLVSELVTAQARLNLIAEETQLAKLLSVAEDMEKISRQLRDNAFQMCLIPVSSLITRTERLVRDLAADLGKPVEFISEGGNTELDKSVIEGLADPLMHIVRNCMDHGLESAEERANTKKPLIATIHLNAYYSGNQVIIEVKDDGRGFDLQKIRSKALERGLITDEAKLSKSELLNLVFLPGFSTAQAVTEISGRGVGMDVVKRKIADLHGNVIIDSEQGKGTTITIKLPLSLSIVDGLLVNIGSTPFIIPLSAVRKIREATYTQVSHAYQATLNIDGQPTIVLNLRESFQIMEAPPKYAQIIMVGYGKNEVGLATDWIVGEYQAVLKPLGKLYKQQQAISGGTILGDGSVALVLDINHLVENLTENHLTSDYAH